MPLYNNILLSRVVDGKSAEAPKKTGVSNASMKLLQDHLMSKKRSQQQNAAHKTQKQGSSSKVVSERNLHSRDQEWGLEEEYDPRVPNSYEILQAEMIKANEMRIAAKRSTGSKVIPNLLDVIDKLDEEEKQVEAGRNKGTAIAPPPSLASSQAPSDDSTRSIIADPTKITEKLDGGSAAARIMSKMGYKVGQGLGKDEQGMSEPLAVGKSDLSTGHIVSAPKISPVTSELTKPKEDSMLKLLRESTRVVLLQNMVGPGEVDEDLESETKEECKKYGDVIRCLIFEIPNKRVPDDEAVRIFVEFRKVESAIKAVSDLNGRYFGGRIVRASFYDLERFNRYELGPT